MDAMKDRQVVRCDVPGAFLQGHWPEYNHCYLEFERLMVDMICEIDPCYKEYVLSNNKNGRKKLYGKLTKVVYGIVWTLSS